MGITIKDIAQRMGVSSSTVSRVLNRSGYVSASTRARIERAMEELQYQPSWVARSLRGCIGSDGIGVSPRMTNILQRGDEHDYRTTAALFTRAEDDHAATPLS